MATQRQHRIASEFASEPSVARLIPGNDNYTTELIRLNNWYSYEKTRKDAYKYHIDYSKKFRNADLKYLSLVDERDVDTTLCWMSRIKMRDIMFSEAHEATLNEYYDKLVLKGKSIFELHLLVFYRILKLFQDWLLEIIYGLLYKCLIMR